MLKFGGIWESIKDGIQEVQATASRMKKNLSWEAKEKRAEFLRDLEKNIDSLSLHGKEILLDILKLIQERWWDWPWTISDDTISNTEKDLLTNILWYFQDWFVSVWDNIKEVELKPKEYIFKLENTIKEERRKNTIKEEQEAFFKDLDTAIENLSLELKKDLLNMLEYIKHHGRDWARTERDNMTKDEQKLLSTIINYFKGWGVKLSENTTILMIDPEPYIQKLKRDIQQKEGNDQSERLKDTLKAL